MRFTPAEQGDNPIRALALALLPGEENSVDALSERLLPHPAPFDETASAQPLLFVDPF